MSSTETTRTVGTTEQLVARGRVSRHGRAVVGVSISAVARRLRSEEHLGTATTDAEGHYRIEYARQDGPIDLVIRAIVDNRAPVEVVRHDPAQDETVDLTAPGAGRSEYDALLDDIEPLLDGAAVTELVEDDTGRDFSFLARATGHDAVQVGCLAVANRHAAATGLPAEPFYGLLRQGLPADLPTLVRRPARDLRAALAAAADTGIIADATDAEEFADQLRAVEIAAAVSPPDDAPRSPVAAIFAAAVPDAAARERIYHAYLDNVGDTASFWAQLADDETTAQHADRLWLALQLGALTGNNAGLVGTLLAKFDDGELTHLRDLVRLDGAWGSLVEKTNGVPEAARNGLAESTGDTTAPYAEAIRARIAQTYPTAHIAYRLSTSDEHAPAARFLADNPEFDLATTPVNAFTVPDDNARRELGGIQRTFKIAPRFEAMRSLREHGFTSSYAVARIGRDAFARAVADTIGPEEAQAIHARATRVHATAVNLVADVRTAGQLDVPWLPKTRALTADIPNWEELFGSVDYCSCKECRSIYSQAAYLVDLLYYLHRLGEGVPPRPNGTPEGPVADALYARRADLADIDLSCDNTNLTLPYVDLVNEVLESVVAPDTVIHPTARQTSGDVKQLRIQPQHVNAGAYDKLRTAVYPWDLPFDLWGEQTRAYLGHLGVGRYQLMKTLNPKSVHTPRLVAEYLGLTTVAYRIIAGEAVIPARTLAEFYGFPPDTTAQALVESLSNVRTLLDRCGMHYADLVALLDTRFVNQYGLLIVTDPDDPCNTRKMTVEGLDLSSLDRLHRFVRLQRALGWTPYDLDRVIRGGNNQGRLDATMLRGVAAVKRLSARLDLPIDRALCLFGGLDTRLYYSEPQLPLYDRVFLDPAVVTPLPDKPNPFLLNESRSELRRLGSLTDPGITALLLGILEVTDTELAELVTGPRSVTPNRVLNLKNLSALVRTVTLARALGLSIGDLLRLIELAGGGVLPGFRIAADDGEAELAGGATMRLPRVAAYPPLATTAESELAGGAPMRLPEPVVAADPPIPIDALVHRLERFLDAVAAILAAGFDVAELDAVLTDIVAAHDGVVPEDSTLSAVLTSLRAALQAIYQQTAKTTDEKGDLTRKNLALLGWDAELVQDAVSTLLGTVAYTAPLRALPAGVALPADLPVRHEVTEEVPNGQLVFTGPMTVAVRQRLEALSTNPADPVHSAYLAAIGVLFRAPRTFAATRMKALRIPIYSAPLATFASDYAWPKPLAGKAFFDSSQRTLRVRGYLPEAELAVLAAVSADPAFQKAVTGLRTAQEEPPATGNVFLAAADIAALFDRETTPADRFSRVLVILAPFLRRTLSEITVKQQLGQAVGLDTATAEVLIGTWLRSPSRASVLADFLVPVFVGSDPAVAVTRAGFPEQFTTLALLYRVALVTSGLRITAAEISWVFGYAGTLGWLDLNSLPSAPVHGASPLFWPFIRLLDLARLRNTIPRGASTLGSYFALSVRRESTRDELLTELSTQAGCNRGELTRIADILGMRAPGHLRNEQALLTLLAAVNLVRTLGVAPDRVEQWLPADVTMQAGQAVWQAAKAKYTVDDWSIVAIPMQDRLRDRQRASLVSYLLAHPLLDEGVPAWDDTNRMYDYFLLDVEMGACQQTTRIAQGVYSVQLFVQRCLLNLEPQIVTSNSDTWREWQWMKQYRLWEANQKIFLYPENYFEPDLRLDKSPFFVEFENELMQREITPDNVETAFLHYLEKFDDAARLLPCGVYGHQDPDTGENTIYVFARTESTPRVYYYRTWVNRSYWTPWRKLDLDIDNDNFAPVVWNRRLYLFWPTFSKTSDPRETKETKPDKMPNPGDDLKVKEERWKIQINWSRLVNGVWEAKKISKEFILGHVVETPGPLGPIGIDSEEYVLRPRVDRDSGDLIVWCVFSNFATTSPLSTLSGYFRLSSRRGSLKVGKLAFLEVTPHGNPGWVMRPGLTQANNNEFIESEFLDPELAQQVHVPEPDPRMEGLDDTLVLRKSPGAELYRLLYPQQGRNDEREFVMFFTDGRRSYAIEPANTGQSGLRLRPAPERPALPVGTGNGPALAVSSAGSELGTLADRVELAEPKVYRFVPFYHPHMESFIGELNKFGVDGLFDRDLQLHPEWFTGPFDFGSETSGYFPDPEHVAQPYPTEPVEFAFGDAYADYNWELFFHMPLLLAQRLSTNQRFAEALQWFHRIFDPTDRSGAPSPQRYWRTKPFFENDDEYDKQRIEKILRRLAEGNPDDVKAVDRWLRNPFQPDVVARLRTTAYQKAVVMKYLDTLIAWGDQLFRQDTLESVNQATQLYILAAELLGRRPEEITRDDDEFPVSYRELRGNFDTFATAITEAENLIPGTEVPMRPAIAPGLGLAWVEYFRIPHNDKLVGYWDTVEDRLFKIRHCQSIDGVQRQLALFGAPIDPSLLVRAVAAGVDLGTVLDDISAPLPYYRFGTMLAKAKEFTAEVTAFGAALLAALEKRDAEALARLRSGHELAVLDAAREVRAQQVKEAKETLAALQKSRDAARDKQTYYATRKYMNTGETAHTVLSASAIGLQTIAAAIDMTVSVIRLLPELKAGSPFTVGASFGGANLGDALKGFAGSLNTVAATLNGAGSLAATLGGYDRRQDDWNFQADQAGTETEQFDKQIAAAEIRLAIAEKELDNHDLARSNAKEADRFLYEKYTDKELYEWMIGQLSTSYFQAYQLAYDVAKRAERGYRHELGLSDSAFIQFGYWDSLHKGLLAGEKLAADLNRIDASYLELNAREFELSKRVSLAQLDPDALIRLRETGTCFVSLPEALFDLDCPGHYLRRIKNVTVTVPCVAGPYTGVNVTASLLRSTVRVDPRLKGDAYARKGTDDRFRDRLGTVESIVTSTAREDAGLFETNLHDERYLPFEGAGVISEWQLSLPDRFRQFDYESITDVVLNFRYTARQGGALLAEHALNELTEALNRWMHADGGKALYRAFSARREFADQWSRFLAPAGEADPALTFTVSKNRFPFLFRGHHVTATKPEIVLVLSRDISPDGARSYVDLYGGASLPVDIAKGSIRGQATLGADPALDGQPRGRFTTITTEVGETDQEWAVTIARDAIAQLHEHLRAGGNRFNPEAVVDVLLVWQYTLKSNEDGQ